MADSPLSAFDKYNQALDEQINTIQRTSAAMPRPRGIFANADPTGLAMIAGLLKPSATGSFAENIGNAAEAVQAPLSSMRKQDLDAQDKIAALKLSQLKLAAEAPMWQAHADLYSNKADQGPNSHMMVLQANALVTEANNVEATNPQLAAQYRAQASQIMKGLLTPEAMAQGLKDYTTANPPEPPAAPNFFDRLFGSITPSNPEDVKKGIASGQQYDPLTQLSVLDDAGNPIPSSAPPQSPVQPISAQPTAAQPAATQAFPTSGNLKTPSQKTLKNALDAIANGADPTAVRQKLMSHGFSVEGLQ